MEVVRGEMVSGPSPNTRLFRQMLRRNLNVKNPWLTSVRNRGELAEGWYDPATLQKAQASAASYDDHQERSKPRGSPTCGSPRPADSSDEDLVGPALPGQEVAAYNKGKRRGPAIPDTQDLELRRGEIHVNVPMFSVY